MIMTNHSKRKQRNEPMRAQSVVKQNQNSAITFHTQLKTALSKKKIEI